MKNTNKKGFTLLELLIVIGILAVLATVAILVINPAELLRRSRDSARLSDLSTIKSAIGLYLTDVVDPDMSASATYNCSNEASGRTIFVSSAVGATNCPTSCAACSPAANFIASSTNPGAINSTGWIPINFTTMSTGSPLGNVPVDPTNTCATTAASSRLVYYYSCNQANLTFIVTGRMESTYYTTTNPVANKDGGTHADIYEVGTNLLTSGAATTVAAQ
jgi:prepilin-type N-terminal cleavage/methylation domain-containing protein